MRIKLKGHSVLQIFSFPFQRFWGGYGGWGSQSRKQKETKTTNFRCHGNEMHFIDFLV